RTASLLTPEFAAPEQLLGDPVTTQTDVFSLGLVLLNLLSGVAPFATRGRSLYHIVEQRLHEAVPAPSDAAAANPAAPVPAAQLGGDLDAIVAGATRRKPADRYASVLELWAELQRFLDHRPVTARHGNAAYRFERFLRRNRLPVTAGAI